MQDHRNPIESEEAEQIQICEENSFAAGHMLGGKYKIISLLGSGGMGKVYWVSQVFLDTDFAMKVLDINRVFDDVQMRRFQFEAKAANSLSHPNLVKVHDFGLLDSNQPYLVMDKIEGTTLADHIRQKRELSLQEAAPLFEQICAGLAYAHEQGIVHRDIKPSNIILVAATKPGSEGSVKILDFGIAKLASEEGGEMQQLTRTGEVFGSPLYMSPEQCSGSPVDHRSDIYSLGCVLFEALTGTPPHMGANALRTMMLHQTESAPLLKQASLGKSFPPALEEIVKKMLHKSPDERYQKISQVADDLNAVLANKRIAKPKVSSAVVKPSKMVTMSEEKLIFLILATILLTAGITLTVAIPAYTNWNKVVGQVSKADPIKLEDDRKVSEKENLGDIEFFQTAGKEIHDTHPEATKLLFDNCDQIKSQKVVKDGKKLRRFVFPERAMGTISSRDSQSSISNVSSGKQSAASRDKEQPRQDNEWEARGVVFVPDDVPLMLHISGRRCPEIFHLTNIIAKIGPTEFTQLGISSNILEDRKVQEQGLQNILSIVSSWKNLEKVAITGLPISTESVEKLGKLKNLSRISIDSPHVDFKLLAAQPFWTRMHTVSLISTQSEDIVAKLSHSTNLNHLNLIHTDISPSSLRSLKTCNNLHSLLLESVAISPSLLDSIGQLRQLKFLYLRNIAVPVDQFQTLSKMPWLEHIELSPLSIKNFQASGYSDRRISFAPEATGN
ncbi:MAG: protein kinase [Cyanobacteria bacterium SZAS-4]|nr:protein kinase [Cyanobacteria bacterium SZAS-4]